MAQPDIFLSYNREDSARAKQFAQALEAEGFSVWWDMTLRSGENYDVVTETALNEAKAVVVLWSPHSVVSRWVRAEATEAERAGKLVPAMIEPCKRPIMFELVHTAELSHWKGNRKDAAWKALVEDLRGYGDKPQSAGSAANSEASSPAPPAPPSRPTRRNALFAAIAALVLLVGGGFAWWEFGPASAFSASSETAEVMVMPFKAVGNGSDETALAAGITSELMDNLRRVPKLRVLTGAGSAGEAHANNRIDGTVQLDGDKLRVSTTLSDSSGQVLWTDSYGQNLNDLFQVEQDIARRVAKSLSVSLDVGFDSKAYGGTNNPDAYASSMQGGVQAANGDLDQAIAYYERAVELDPDYAQAWGHLATAYGYSLYYVSSKQEEDELLAKEDMASARAVAISPDVSGGQLIRAWYELTIKDFVAADATYHKLVKLDPGNDPGWKEGLAQTAAQFGRISEALKFEQEAGLIDPYYKQSTVLLWLLIDARRFDATEQLYEEQAARNPFAKYAGAQFVYWPYLLQGKIDKAREAARIAKFESLYLNIPDLSFDARDFPDLPPDRLKEWADKNFGYSGRTQLVARAMFASQLGHQDVALRYLKLAFERPGFAGNNILWQPALANLRKTDGFAQFVTDRGLVAAWRKSGDWGDFCKEDAAGKVSCV